VQQWCHNEHDNKDGECKRIAYPAWIGNETEYERADDKIELVDAWEGCAPLATAPPLQERCTDIAGHRAEWQGHDNKDGKLGDLDSERIMRWIDQLIEHQCKSRSAGPSNGSSAPGLAVAEKPSVAHCPTAIYRSVTTSQHGDVVRDVGRQHRPDSRHDDYEHVHARWVERTVLNRPVLFPSVL